jgi:transcriptional regulator with XRE-family HTH domain
VHRFDSVPSRAWKITDCIRGSVASELSVDEMRCVGGGRVQPASPEAARLAQRLRRLREQEWPDARLTQRTLAQAFSAEEPLAAATVSSWESGSAPKLPPRHRLRAYARFFATPRSVEGASPRLLPWQELTPEEQAECKRLETELFRLRSLAADDPAEEETAFSNRTWHFKDSGLVTLVCAELPSDQTGPLASPSNPNYTELQAFADVDALAELHGHIRAENPRMTVHFKIPADIGHDDLTGHITLLGGVVWNEITDRLSEEARLPVRQFRHPGLPSGEIFIAEVDGAEREFWPKWKNSEQKVLAEDVGLLVRVPNPLNSSRTLTICNGIHSRGVYGAVRSLTDMHLRDANERYISGTFGNSASFAILMSVRVINNKTITPDFSGNGVVLYRWSQDVEK